MNKFFSVKGMDKALNVTIIVLGGLWLFGAIIGNKDKDASWEDETRSMFEQHQNEGGTLQVSDMPAWQAELVSEIDAADERPLLLFIYASWCPYCKQMFPIIDSIAREMGDKYRVMGFSIDQSKQALDTYLGAKSPAPAFETITVKHVDEFPQFGHIVRKKGLQFTGAIPYIAVFDNAKVVRTFGGAVDRARLIDALPKK